jgi:hypothetical protein
MKRNEFISYMGKGLVIGGISLYLPSCKKFLAEKPKGILSPGTFFNSDQAVKAAINGLYSLYHNNSLHGKVGLDRFYEYGADTIGPSRLFDQVELIQNYIVDEGNINSISQNGGAPLTWQDLYRVIQNSNIILKNTDGNDKITAAGQKQYGGEALFFRAYSYYHLTNLWGDVPYFRDDIGIDEIQVLERSNKDQIREDIIKDLQEAQDRLPDSYPTGERGRVSKWAAATLMVKIYLWQKKWKEARDKAVEIINNSPHDLLDNYADVFNPTNEYNKEIIWAIDFVKDSNPNDWPDHFTPRLQDEPQKTSDRSGLSAALAARQEGFTGYGLAVPLPDLVEKFPVDDLRRSSNVITNYLGFDLHFPYVPKFWALNQLTTPRGNHGENKKIFRLSDVYLMAAEAENELSGPANAYAYINKVRERAYNPIQPLSGLTQQQFREAIYDERKWELAAENHRRMDLIRWGILLDVVKSTKYRVYNPAVNITPKNVLLPIPAAEIDLNPNLLKTDPTNNGYR